MTNYNKFKKKHLHLKGFKIIERKDHEMIEFVEEGANVRVYFSNPHIDKLLGVK